jgi:hypothetical protein
MRFYTRENEIRLHVDYREIDVSPFQIHPVVLPRKTKKNKNNQHTDKQNKNKKQKTSNLLCSYYLALIFAYCNLKYYSYTHKLLFI